MASQKTYSGQKVKPYDEIRKHSVVNPNKNENLQSKYQYANNTFFAKFIELHKLTFSFFPSNSTQIPESPSKTVKN